MEEAEGKGKIEGKGTDPIAYRLLVQYNSFVVFIVSLKIYLPIDRKKLTCDGS